MGNYSKCFSSQKSDLPSTHCSRSFLEGNVLMTCMRLWQPFLQFGCYCFGHLICRHIGREVHELVSGYRDRRSMLLLLLSTPLHQRAASRVQHPNHVAANSLSPQVARKGSTLSAFVQRSRLEREVGRDLHSNKWEEV